ncbi:hypothetical protein OH77DRAFT_43594 [Trametes cingulata]|nr:hypothetical protein OH77DRAFT_43594 [Trametes cingulata]
MQYVPEPPLGILPLFLCTDLKYGILDPTQWPQLYTPEYEFLCTLRRRPTCPHPRYPSCIWWKPQQATDFCVVEGSVFKSLGLISTQSLAPLRQAVNDLVPEIADYVNKVGRDERLARFQAEMLAAADRLVFFPSTFRDALFQVVQVQRFWLMARAVLDYHAVFTAPHKDKTGIIPNDIEHGWMGAFCADPTLVQKLLDARIPVWHVRPRIPVTGLVVQAEVPLRQPDQEDVATKPLDPDSPPLYSGAAGPHHLQLVCFRTPTYLDLSGSPLLVSHGPQPYPKAYSAVAADKVAPSGSSRAEKRSNTKQKRSKQLPYAKPHPSTIRGRDKFMELPHKWMPPALPAWQQAMESTDRTAPAKHPTELWGYWVPEPALLVGPVADERTERYIMNWLRMRPAWLYLLRAPRQSVPLVSAQWWRDYLNGLNTPSNPQNPTRTAQRREKIAKVFSGVLDMKDYQEGDGGVSWFSHHFKRLDHALCPLILWEVFELGFRYELLALDRVLVPAHGTRRVDVEREREHLLSLVFADRSLYALERLPTTPAGLAAPVPQARVRCLEALRQVELRWPLCPEVIAEASPLTISSSAVEIESLEREISAFYVHTFYAYSGRAPLVPHALPSSLYPSQCRP